MESRPNPQLYASSHVRKIICDLSIAAIEMDNGIRLLSLTNVAELFLVHILMKIRYGSIGVGVVLDEVKDQNVREFANQVQIQLFK